MKLHYTSGFRLLNWLLDFPHWPRAGPVTRLWLISGCLVAANGLLVHAACKSTLKVKLFQIIILWCFGNTSFYLRIGLRNEIENKCYIIMKHSTFFFFEIESG